MVYEYGKMQRELLDVVDFLITEDIANVKQINTALRGRTAPSRYQSPLPFSPPLLPSDGAGHSR